MGDLVTLDSTATRWRGRVLTLAVLLLLLAGGGWWAWRWWSAPAPPELPGDWEPVVFRFLESLRAKVVQAPRSADAWGEFGMALFGNGQNELAYTCLVQAEKLDPGSPIWPHLQAIKFHRDDNMEATIACLQRAVPNCEARDRDNAVPRLLLAELLLDRYQTESAQAHARAVLVREPDNAWAHYLMGAIAGAHGDTEASLKHLTQAAVSRHLRRKAYQQLAVTYRRLEQESVAAEFAAKAGQLPKDPDWPDPYYLRAMQTMRGTKQHWQAAVEASQVGRPDESLRHYRDVAEETKDPPAQARLGKALLEAGELELAERVLRAALAAQPEMVQAQQQLGLVLMELGESLSGEAAQAKFREAAAAALQALTRQPEHAAAHWVHGLALRRLGQKQEAIAALQKAAELRPERYQYHWHLGEALAEDGRRDEGLRQLQLAVDLAPTNDRRPAEALARLRKDKGPS